ncbi:hypothetical protein B0H10DRAFT_2213381 [Mycena sp. CBHHK59/15]|nr:hypothetical protein B0H10DRAFT_2213381 [Mycena sp. CBHHK59/15]
MSPTNSSLRASFKRSSSVSPVCDPIDRLISIPDQRAPASPSLDAVDVLPSTSPPPTFTTPDYGHPRRSSSPSLTALPPLTPTARFRRAMSLPCLDASVKSVRDFSAKPALRRAGTYISSPLSSSSASAGTPSPASTTPLVSPRFKRAMSLSALDAPMKSIRDFRPKSLRRVTKKIVSRASRKPSAVAPVESSDEGSTSGVDSAASARSLAPSVSTTSCSRSSSISSFEHVSFTTTEASVSMAMRWSAFPSTCIGFFASLFALLAAFLSPYLGYSLPQRQIEPVADIDVRAFMLNAQTRPPTPIHVLRRNIALAPIRRRVLTNGLPPNRRVSAASRRTSRCTNLVSRIPRSVARLKSPAPETVTASRRRSSTPSFTLMPTVREESVGIAA